MKARFDDHIIVVRPVRTETGALAPYGTHGFILRALDDPERYVAELYMEGPPDDDVLGILGPDDFAVITPGKR